jgi:hypothetical protein
VIYRLWECSTCGHGLWHHKLQRHIDGPGFVYRCQYCHKACQPPRSVLAEVFRVPQLPLIGDDGVVR